MRKYLRICAVGLVGSAILSACNDDKQTVPPAPASTAGVGFESYAQNLVEINTCEKTEPPEIDTIDFTFASDQDTAQPRDVSAVAPACTIS